MLFISICKCNAFLLSAWAAWLGALLAGCAQLPARGGWAAQATGWLWLCHTDATSPVPPSAQQWLRT